jgi:hypothetical protein
MEANSSLKIPRGLVVLAMVVTAGITAWALLGKKLSLSWPADAAGAAPAARRAPTILVGRAAPHGELGPCTLCHTVMNRGNKAIPPIVATARIPHQYQNGVCINCHRVATGLTNSVTTASQPSSATPVSPAQQSTTQQSATKSPQPAVRGSVQPQASARLPSLAIRPTVAAEAEWLGARLLELDPDSARRHGLPSDLKGLLVTRVQAEAAAVGLTAGDVLVAVNRHIVGTLERLDQVTQGGALQGAVVQVLRNGTLFQAVLSRAASPAAPSQTAAGPAPSPPPAALPARPLQPAVTPHDHSDHQDGDNK